MVEGGRAKGRKGKRVEKGRYFGAEVVRGKDYFGKSERSSTLCQIETRNGCARWWEIAELEKKLLSTPLRQKKKNKGRPKG